MAAKMQATHKQRTDKERVGSVYILVNLVNGKGYVGQTVRTPEVRWAEHYKSAFIHKDPRPLYRSIRKYGVENFSADVSWRGPESKLNSAEKRLVKVRATYIDKGWGYNLTTGGGQFKMSLTARRKLSKSAKAYYATPEHRAWLTAMKTADWAKPDAKDRHALSPESQEARTSKLKVNYAPSYVRVNHGDILRNSYATDLTRGARVSASLKAFNAEHPEVRKRVGHGNAGRKQSRRHHELVRIAATAQWADPEARAKKIAGMRGKKRSAESRVRMSAAAKGRKWSEAARASHALVTSTPEYKARMADLKRAQWSDAKYRAIVASSIRAGKARKKTERLAAANGNNTTASRPST